MSGNGVASFQPLTTAEVVVAAAVSSVLVVTAKSY
jgi:hypothetical protein